MNHKRFRELLDELDENSVQTLSEKNQRYSANGDALHNFNSGGEVLGGTPAQACWGYLTKHLVALRDMVQRNDFSNREDFLEKCQDSINYIRFLWCIGNEKPDDTKVETERYICKHCGKILSSGFVEHIVWNHGIYVALDATLDDILAEHYEKETKYYEK